MKTSANNTVYPDTRRHSSVSMEINDLSLINYDRSDKKSAEELLFEAVSESDKGEFEKKWKMFEKKTQKDFLTVKEIQKLVRNLDEQKQWSPLHYAVANDNHTAVEILIGKKSDDKNNDLYKCDINILGGNAENVLHVAAQAKKLWPTDKNVVHNPPVETIARLEKGITNIFYDPGSLSSVSGIPATVEMLISRHRFRNRIHINHQDDEGRTPLHLAVMANRYAFVCYLLRNGASLTAKTKLNANVFHFIFIPSEPIQTTNDLRNMFKLLREQAEEKNKMHLLQARTLDNRSPLVMAVGHRNCPEDVLKILIEEMDHTQLLIAFDVAAKRRSGNPDSLKLLLRTDHMNIPWNELIQIACRHNHRVMLEELMKHYKIDNILNKPNNAGYTPILTAAFYEAKECVEYLLKKSEIDLKKSNSDRETILHILAKRTSSSDLFKMVWSHMNSNGMMAVMTMQDKFENTPLHCAAQSNQLDICKQLLGDSGDEKDLSLDIKKIINKKNAVGRTAILLACEMGHEGIVKYFWDITKEDRTSPWALMKDDERKTCLHLAAANGHCNIVQYLIDTVKMDVDLIADRRLSPLHLACQYGHSNVVKYLLEHKASSTLRDARLYNCLEIAILNHHSNLVKDVLFNHDSWRDMMRNAQPIKDTKAYDTPMRKLIRYMPDVSLYLIDTKLTRIVGGPGQKVFKRIYDYEFFQDELTVERWYKQGAILDSSSDSCSDRWKQLSASEIVRCAWCCFCCLNPRTIENDSKPYTDNSYTLIRNHPLFIVAQQSSCPALVQHPYNVRLRKHKFNLFGGWFLIISCLLYTTYLGLFTAIVLQNNHPQYYYGLINVTYSDDLTVCQYVSNTLVNQNIAEAFKSDSYRRLRWAAFGFLIVFITKNAILILSLFPKLLRMGAYYLEVAVLVLSFVYIYDWFSWLNPVILRCPIQHQLGAFALLLAWINFLTYVRCMPVARIGIYVVMLQVILWKFIQFIPVLMVIICGFGFSYWMLLQNQTVYKTPIESLIRTGLMMFDLGYEDRLYKPSEGGVGYYTILYVMFIITAIAFSIFVVNLMISLAVGEIPTLNDQSQLWQHQLMYNLLSDYEILRVQIRMVIDFVTCGLFIKTDRRGPNCCKCLQRRQDKTLRRDENHVNYVKRFGRYVQKHVFDERIQDNVESTVDKQKQNK